MSKRLTEAQYRESIKRSRSGGSFGWLVRPTDWMVWEHTDPQA